MLQYGEPHVLLKEKNGQFAQMLQHIPESEQRQLAEIAEHAYYEAKHLSVSPTNNYSPEGSRPLSVNSK